MNKHQNNIVRMWIVTDDVFVAFAVAIAAIPGLLAAIVVFRGYKTSANTNTGKQQQTTVGTTSGKRTKKTKMIKKCLILLGAIGDFAKVTGNEELAANVSYTLWQLQRKREPELLVLMNGFHTLGVSMVADLADYNIDAAFLTAFKDTIIAYSDVVPKTREQIGSKATATNSLKTIMKQGQQQLETIDGLMLQFEESNPDFFNAYTSAREIIDYGEDFTPDAPPVTPPVS